MAAPELTTAAPGSPESGRRYLHILPRAGLTNRMRALASAMRAAELSGRDLVLTWTVDEWMGARFEDLFENRFDTGTEPLEGLARVVLRDPVYLDPALLRGIDVAVVEISACTAFSMEPGAHAHGGAFWHRLRPQLLALRPIAPIRAEARRIVAGFAPATVGVHIRSGSESVWFEKARHISTDAFLAAVRREVGGQAATGLYVASDAVAPLEAFRRAFPGRVTTLESACGHVPVRTQDDAAAVRMALVDLLCLAACARIVGSYYSSFSEVAAVLGGRPLARIGEPDGLRHHLRILANILTPRNLRRHGMRWVFSNMLPSLSAIRRLPGRRKAGSQGATD